MGYRLKAGGRLSIRSRRFCDDMDKARLLVQGHTVPRERFRDPTQIVRGPGATPHSEILERRERMLLSVAKALSLLLSEDLHSSIGDAIRTLGEGVDADRVYIFEHHPSPTTGDTLTSQRYEWSRGEVEPQIDNPELQNMRFADMGFGRWMADLAEGKSVAGPVRTFPPSEQPLLEGQDILSLLVVPVQVAGSVWGFMGFDDCHSERDWSAAEEATLTAAAASIGEAFRRDRQQAALAESEERLRLALEAAEMGSWGLDLVAGTVTGSSKTVSLLGLPGTTSTWSLEELYRSLGGEVRRRVESSLAAASEGAVHVSAEFQAAKSGRWFRCVGRIALDNTGTPVRARGTIVDMTPEKLYEKRLVEAVEAAEASRAEAEEATRLKSALMANMSHEIRTPLTAILGYAEILSEEVADGTGDVAEYARLIDRGGRRLLNTLTSVLDLAQIEAGRRDLDLAIVDVRTVMEETVDLLRPAAQEKGLALDCELPDAPTYVRVDVAALGRVLTNLVGNAIKFTEEGMVRLALASEAGEAVVRVLDTGVGISEAFLPTVFEEFRQESEGHGRRFEGNGLGLAITHRLVEMLGGTIAVESAPGEGSTFTVRLPLVVEFEGH